ncbi:MAG: LysE family translocator [Hyphomicrobiales bacterium]|nr:LysE family translocator [Hyphomicrobiales bacterium]
MQDVLPIILFTLANSLTPGPNNIMLTASGAAFGYRRTIPHILGIAAGFPLMTLAVGLGLGRVFALYPALHEALKWLGAAYLLYLAWRVATAGRPENAASAKPLTFTEAALFQWVNPKAWTMVLSAVPAFTTVGGNYDAELLTITAVFAALCIPSASLWCAFGMAIRRLVSDPASLRAVNYALAAAVALSVVMLFI